MPGINDILTVNFENVVGRDALVDDLAVYFDYRAVIDGVANPVNKRTFNERAIRAYVKQCAITARQAKAASAAGLTANTEL